MVLRHRSWLKKTGWLSAELVVVFVGVFAAGLLSDYREDRERELRRQQVHEMLLDEVAFMKGQYRRSAGAIDSLYVRTFVEPYERGERPALRPLDLTVGTPISKDLWDAMLQTGGLDALDPATLQLAQLYFAAQASVLKWADETSARSDLLVVPNLGGDTGPFYQPDTTLLAPAYAWYPRSIRQLRSGMDQLHQLADSLHRHLDGLPAPPPTGTDGP